MPEQFKKAIEDIAKAGTENGGLTDRLMLDAILALEHSTSSKLEVVADEVKKVNVEVKANRRSVADLVERHQASYMHMTKQEFEIWVAAYGVQRDEFTRTEHDKRHTAYEAKLEGERRSRISLIKRRLGSGSWQVILIVISVTIGLTLTTLYTQSCVIHSHMQPFITTSPTP